MTVHDADRLALTDIAQELDVGAMQQRALYRRRVAVWKRAMKRGASAVELAEISRVSAVTVRQLIRQSK